MQNNTETIQNGAQNIHDGADGESKRQIWSGKFEFLMSCVSLSVGLGNIWRFPFTAYENGGGAFLIPYIVVLFLIGKPMYNMEALLGQFSSKSSLSIWSICPVFLGVGFGQVFAISSILTYYSALVAVAFMYIFSSFQSILPWSFCRSDWTEICIDSNSMFNFTLNEQSKLYSSSELFFTKVILNESEDISAGIGFPSWKLTVALLGSWIITFFVVIRGVRSLGKVAYFLAIFPYAMLITLLIRAVTLEGAADGILFLLRPKWLDLLKVKVWKEAVVQCFFSLTVSLGPIVTFSSYNKFNHCVQRDAMIVTTLDTLTSLLAGITTFGILGNLAHNMKTSNISDVVRSGTGLAFISYPDALAKFNTSPQLFSVLFFLMLSVLGIGTIAALQTTVVTIICDKLKISNSSFWKVSIVVSVCGFLIGLVYVTPGGQWILNLVDYYAGTYVVFFMACCEVIGVAWIYGLQNFCDDVEFMTKTNVTLYWRLCWAIFTPILMAFIFIYSLIELNPLSYGGRNYPLLGDVSGWVVLLIGLLQFPLWAVWCITKNFESSLIHTLQNVATPNSKWGPAVSSYKYQWLIHKEILKKKRMQNHKEVNIFWQKLNIILDRN